MINYKSIIFAAFFIMGTAIAACAQKLPNIQPASLRAPANVKVDGKPKEWGGRLQAYNHATDIAYTIANDDDNIYLVIQSADAGIIHKINSGRISFTINKPGKKNNDGAVVISYPVSDKKDKPNLMLKHKPEIIPGSAESVKKADSFMYANNKRITDRAKMIKVTGIAGMDTLISVYNEDGIKAAALFDNKMVYTCEISVSLKLLGLSAADKSKFSYNITLNPVSFDDLPGVEITRAPNGEITAINIHKDQSLPGSNNITALTDFWADYTLVKK